MNQLKPILFFFLHIVIFGATGFVFSTSCQSNPANTASEKMETAPEISHELSSPELNGKTIFLGKCAACHNINKEITANALAGGEKRWVNKKELFDFIRYPAKAIEKNTYLKGLQEKYKITMTSFPELSDTEIEEILSYIKSQENIQKP
jgi:mono/diheme cytochrome c family protein